jgi:hypothetical protein
VQVLHLGGEGAHLAGRARHAARGHGGAQQGLDLRQPALAALRERALELLADAHLADAPREEVVGQHDAAVLGDAQHAQRRVVDDRLAGLAGRRQRLGRLEAARERGGAPLLAQDDRADGGDGQRRAHGREDDAREQEALARDDRLRRRERRDAPGVPAARQALRDGHGRRGSERQVARAARAVDRGGRARGAQRLGYVGGRHEAAAGGRVAVAPDAAGRIGQEEPRARGQGARDGAQEQRRVARRRR